MKTQLDWQQILTECKTNIQTAIKPLFKTLREPQPNLGMGAGGDLMKPVDLAAETAIVETLKRHNISFTLISEESGVKEYGNSPNGCYLCVDPIDGTTNLIHGLPFYASSIAVSSQPELGAVYAGMVADLAHDEVFIGLEGKGAYRNGERLHASKTASLDEAVIGLDLNAYKAKLNMTCAAALIENIKHTRHFGANALEVCHVAAGLTDGFIDIRNKIRTTDVAAAFLIAKEAGAIVTDANNKPINVPLDPKQTLNFVASANMEIHKQILSLVQSDV
ncbi:MAG: D-fructose 1,6-bisphosphatase [Candidatus Bathyarchaeota archaeon]|nr:D-fructose 1,6-bisphosphatase [Candidatus Bathyarchaeota archaeon]